MIKLYSSPWRKDFEDFVKGVETDLLIASPFIKTSEASWICKTIERKPVRLQVLTNIRSDSVLSGSLDIPALKLFANTSLDSKVFAVPKLHAKVYVRDADLAIITSANLTPGGLDLNYEYGVALYDTNLVSQIRRDFESYSRVGSPIDRKVLLEMESLSTELAKEFQKLEQSAKSELRQKFDKKLKQANIEFLSAQIGKRSKHSLFADAIAYVLSKEALPTSKIHTHVQKLLPDLCDNSVELVIDGERFGKRWKHDVRNAQQFLKRQGRIRFDGRYWHLVDAGFPLR